MYPFSVFFIKELLLEEGSSPFGDRFLKLDTQAAVKVQVALARMEQGNLSKPARVQSELAYARALLQQATSLLLQGEPHTAKLLLRDLVNASIGFEQLASDMDQPAKSLHRMLSAAGNPTLSHVA